MGGVCVAGCAQDFDCPGGQRCEGGACVPIEAPECDQDSDCAGGERCSGGNCVPIGAECNDDGDCDAGERCTEGSCVSIPGFDAGMMDGGRGTDAGMIDGGMTAFDAGMTTMMDGGRDAGRPFDAGGMMCMGTTGCPATQRCCNDRCANREVPVNDDGRSDSSFQNCGACNSPCNPDRASACSRTGGTPRCMCGLSSPCTGGLVCVPSSGGWDCTDLNTDEDNCGSVGNACGENETCVAGHCACGDGPPCGIDHSCCDGRCIETANDPDNCGGCGIECAPYGNRCTGGDCTCNGRSCARPMGSSLGQLCCGDGVCIPQDNNNCNGCFMMCDPGSSCIVSSFGGSQTCCSNSGFPGFCF